MDLVQNYKIRWPQQLIQVAKNQFNCINGPIKQQNQLKYQFTGLLVQPIAFGWVTMNLTSYGTLWILLIIINAPHPPHNPPPFFLIIIKLSPTLNASRSIPKSASLYYSDIKHNHDLIVSSLFSFLLTCKNPLFSTSYVSLLTWLFLTLFVWANLSNPI